jgi:ABC-type glycerol-3-phosphate transport system substrate-binding protein
MARVTRRVAVILTAILAVTALAACGGGTSSKDKNAYAKKVNAAQTKFAQTVTTVSQAGGSKNSVSQQRKTLQRFAKAIDGVVTDLRGIDAPTEVTKEHARLTAVMTGFGKAIAEANAAMRNPTPSGIELAKKRVGTATQSVNARVNAAIAAINAKLRGK